MIKKRFQACPDFLIPAIKTAIATGYRSIDTAAAYGNEEIIGQALKECFQEAHVSRSDVFITTKFHAGLVSRDSLFFTTKCPRTHLNPEKQEEALRESLKKLQLEYVDLYLAHNPCALDPAVTVEDIWRGLEILY